MNPKQELINEVTELVETETGGNGDTTLEEYILEGDTEDMTAEEIATEWDELEEKETDL